MTAGPFRFIALLIYALELAFLPAAQELNHHLGTKNLPLAVSVAPSITRIARKSSSQAMIVIPVNPFQIGICQLAVYCGLGNQMAAVAPSVFIQDNLGDGTDRGAKDEIVSSQTSELVIALCGPIGTPLHKVAKTFKDCLENEFDYEYCKEVRLSTLIEEHKGAAPTSPSFLRVKDLITKGDELREAHGAGVLAELAVSQIVLDREKKRKDEKTVIFAPRRVCHIIDSIKNQEELDLLRLVYRDMVYVVGVYSPLPKRVQSMERSGMTFPEIYELIDQDSGEEFSHGQTVRDTLPNSDFFLRIDSDTDSQIKVRVERFLNLILGAKVMTPTLAETAMYAASSAAGSSACLSRQVGAAITDESGEVIAVGWNDVPKFGGSLYMATPADDPNSDKDHRCWNLDGGTCFNDLEKSLIADTLVEELTKGGAIAPENRKAAKAVVMSNSKIKSLIEFSRSVHAEMHAIINAGKLSSKSIIGGKLFVTTYPCHSCARHIVASGVKEVFYIEPYRKSLATKLHKDAITEDESDYTKVRVLPYDGVAPARYLKLFRVPGNSRKAAGKLIQVDPKMAKPRFDKTMEALPTLEAMVVESLRRKKLIALENM